MEYIFWTLLSLILYCYFGYPLLIWGMAKMRPQEVHKRAYTPGVSVVLAVWNEEDVIEEKIRNLLSLDYPQDKIEFLIGSDGSTDRTNVLVKKFDDSRLRLVEDTRRRGKAATINKLVHMARNGIIVFTDARQIFADDAVKQLAANFSDQRVGCVSGELIFSRRSGATAKGVNLYWNYEKFLRSQESKLHSMLGATGAIYAIRKELFVDIPADVVLDDMFVPLHIIKKGYRAILDESAKAYDEVADSPKEEHRRKARTLFGNYQIFKIFPEMFNPFISPIAVQLFSHKLLRVLIPFFMIAVFIINGMICRGVSRYAPTYTFYQFLFLAQILFYALALLGFLARHQKYGIFRLVSSLCSAPYVFCLLNFSALMGFWRFVRSNQNVAWEKARG